MAGMPGIIIKIAADTRDAIQGLGSVNKALGRTSSASEKFGRAAKIGFGLAAGGAVAAGAAFVKFAGDAVSAAIEEEKAVARLTTTMKNLGLASKTAGVEEFIDNLQYSANVADNDIRPAFDRLIRSTKDVAEAEKATGIALDIAAAKDRDVVDVANILGKAYDGNTMALGRLGVGIDSAVLKSGDMAKITDELIRLFGGQAGAQADTLGGSIRGVQIAWDELVESFGQGVTGSGAKSVEQLQAMEASLRGLKPAAEDAGEDLKNVGLAGLTTYDRLKYFNDLLEKQDWPGIFHFVTTSVGDSDEAVQELVNDARALNSELWDTQTAALDAASALHAMSGAIPEIDHAIAQASNWQHEWDALDQTLFTQGLAKTKRDAKAAAAAIKAAQDAADAKRERERRAAEAKAKAKAAREKAKRDAEARAAAAERLDELWHYVPFDPVRYSRARQIALRRADGRAAQRDARTGSRP